MTIRFLTLSAGPSGIRMPGDVLDVPDSEARALLERGFAVPVGQQDEKAVQPEAEQRSNRRRR